MLLTVVISIVKSSSSTVLLDSDNLPFYCPNDLPETCKCSSNPVFEMSCISDYGRIEVEGDSNVIRINCSDAFDETIYVTLPELNIGDVHELNINGCPTPYKNTFRSIIDKLGIRNIQVWRFTNAAEITGLRLIFIPRLFQLATEPKEEDYDDSSSQSSSESEQLNDYGKKDFSTEEFDESDEILLLRKVFFGESQSDQNKLILNLGNNNIETIAVENLPENLEELNLSGNNLKTLTPNVIKHLNEMKSLRKLELGNNPWDCDCDFQEFIQNNVKIVDFMKIVCTDGELAIIKNDWCLSSTSIVWLLGFLLGGASIVLYFKLRMKVKTWLFSHHSTMD